MRSTEIGEGVVFFVLLSIGEHLDKSQGIEKIPLMHPSSILHYESRHAIWEGTASGFIIFF